VDSSNAADFTNPLASQECPAWLNAPIGPLQPQPWARNRYQVVEIIGRGGMGLVLRAEDRARGHDVALKVLTQARNLELRGRFEQEWRVLARLDHPGLVRVLDFGDCAGLPWYSMEFLAGADLFEQLSAARAEGGLPDPDWTTARIAEVADALAYCHAQGVVHRDIKPSNIIIQRSDGRARLVDFGVVRLDRSAMEEHHRESAMSLTNSGEMVGTIAFMAPEQLAPEDGHGAIGPACDIWSLGICAHECLTGQVPFGGEGYLDTYRAIMAGPPPDPRQLNPEVPASLAELVLACLAREPDQRPSAAELAAGLRASETFDGPPEGQSRSAGLALILVSLGLFCLLSILLWPRPPSFVQAPKLDAWTREPSLELRLRVQPPDAKVLLGERLLSPDARGRIRAPVELSEGLNELVLRFADDQTNQLHLSTHFDPAPPVLQVEGMRNRLVIVEGAQLRGRVGDASPVSLSWCGQPVLVAPDGAFSVSVPEDFIGSGLLLALDAAGNKASLKLAVQTKPGIATLVTRLLSDLVLWSAASRTEQELVVGELGRRLGTGWRFASMRVYRCGKQRLRIASYQHQKTGLELALIPGGELNMGLADLPAELSWCRRIVPQFKEAWLKTATPLRRVKVAPFLIGRSELPQSVWDALGGRDARQFRGPKLPIVGVSWDDARAWLKQAGGGLRLPSEVEWEYAARAGTKTRFYWGDEPDPSQVWFAHNTNQRPEPSELHLKRGRVNAFGLADMLGNVWEWCEDGWLKDLSGLDSSEPRRAKNPKSRARVFRGGGWANPIVSLRSRYRDRIKRESQSPILGVRVACSIPAP